MPSPHTLAFPHTCNIAKCISLASTFGHIKAHAAATIFARASSASRLSLTGTSACAYSPMERGRWGGGGLLILLVYLFLGTIQVCVVDTDFAVWTNHTVTHKTSSL